MVWLCFRCQVSGVGCQHRRWLRASSLIGKETLKRRISNVECQRNVFYLLNINKAERSDSTLRHSIFDIRYSAVRFLSLLRPLRASPLA
jgi:hypothetical protein